MTTQLISQKASQIRALFLDVDGVLTDGTIYLTENATEMKRFNIQDGIGIKSLQKIGIAVAIISGRNSNAVTHRAKELGIQHVFQGIHSKTQVFESLLQTLSLKPKEIAYMGDDMPDLALMQLTGLSIAPRNAVFIIKKNAHWITTRKGGLGAVREVCDFLIRINKEKRTP